MASMATTAAPGSESPHHHHTGIRLGGSVLGERRHICAFFNSRDAEYGVTLPFIKDGFECGDKAFHVVDRRRQPDHLQRLRSAGIDSDAMLRSRLMRTHPMVIIGGILQVNPFYVEPDTFLEELRERRALRKCSHSSCAQ